MSRIAQLEPAGVFHFFEEICRIPHGSGNVERISNYLKSFAQERGLVCIQDAVKNIVIIKEASAGYEQEEPVILQGHMDMVAVKKPDCPIDMRREGLDPDVDGDWLFARGTSLGGDDGIAVAYVLALLDAEDIPHPRLEVVITVDEETGMEGAKQIDLSMCRGRRMLNLDNEEEGVFLTSCAGGGSACGRLTVSRERKAGVRIAVNIEGLQGGHSGSEIDKGRANANALAGRLLYALKEAGDIRLIRVEGGSADNAIPASCRGEFWMEESRMDAFCSIVKGLEEILRREHAKTDPGVRLRMEKEEKGEWEVLTREDTRRIMLLLFGMPDGVQRMSVDIPGLVQTSLNLGILKTEGDTVTFDYSVRSSVGSEKDMILDKISMLISSQGGVCQISDGYPAWEYRQDSPLRERMIRIYEEMYGKAPRVEAIHAGLECGILSGKLPGLDCVSIGPDMKDIHTPEERLSISSTRRVWEYLLEVLKQKEKA